MLSATHSHAAAAACSRPPLLLGASVQRPRRLALRQQPQQQPPLHVCGVFSGATSNPAFTYLNTSDIVQSPRRPPSELMTFDGTISKAGLLLLMSTASAAVTWMQIFSGNSAAIVHALGVAKISGLVGFAAIIASMFKPQWAPVTAPMYALCKGIAMAGMSAMLEMQYPGIAMNAVLLTFSTAASLFVALKARIITITERFADTVKAVTGGYFVAMLLIFLGSLVGLRLPGLFSGGPLAIGFSLVAAGLAAGNLLVDMDEVMRASYSRRLPRAMEWFFAQSLMVSLVWMYTEILRLLWMLAGGRQDN